MLPDNRFLQLDKKFWANVRTISEILGYTTKHTRQVRVYTLEDMRRAMEKVGLGDTHLQTDQEPTPLSLRIQDYFAYRAEVLNTFVEPRLMDANRARDVFYALKNTLQPQCPLPMNKQSGDKKAPAYFTGLVNMLIEANTEGMPCDYSPRKLTTITRNHEPIRTFARRVDGCFPGCTNPVAIWEIKEYYYTTTFGSRVADAVYETLLDGFEIEELREHEAIDIKHLLMIDAYETWWQMGRSYLCRLIDMLHMGFVDEILFGYEVVERLPEIAREWVYLAKSNP